ncbi:NmrA-domain-containing protein [Exidia glandulosa HHB12029]|uniref:NmrA-domain-containing protein n=1 Tax=Exidia glandulosa HHB12029 TaxID=1314781 RepID=A0A165GCK2_EXIGL|nr:NmrA-domain-containing protein [Exidia glandulosa HHB12029]
MFRIATVFGATGLQGGSVVKQLLKDGVFKPRAVTRNPDSDKAKGLVKLGADVVAGDLADYPSIKKAVAGSEVVFAVTTSNRGQGTRELEQGKFIMDAAKEVGVKYLVWSSIESIVRISGGKYQAVALDDKAELDNYIRSTGIPHSILHAGGFLENLTRPAFVDCAKLNDDGEVEIKTRWVKGTVASLSWIEHDLGLSVSSLFNAYANGRLDEINGKEYAMICSKLPIEDWYEIIETTLGRKVNVTWLPTMNLKMLDDMYDSAKEFEWYKNRQIPDPGLVALGVKFGALEDFVRQELKPHLGL